MDFLGNIPALTVLLCLGVSIINPVVEAITTTPMISTRTPQPVTAVTDQVPDRCLQYYNSGVCEGTKHLYYFHKFRKDCSLGHFTSCPGNSNHFETEAECRRICAAHIPQTTTTTTATTTSTPLPTTTTTTTPQPTTATSTTTSTTTTTTEAAKTTMQSNIKRSNDHHHHHHHHHHFHKVDMFMDFLRK